MAILVDADTKVICQGLTARAATFHCEQAIAYGTQLVAGVRPGKGGTRHLHLPVFDTVAEAKAATGAEVSLVFVPPAAAAEAILEAAAAEMPLVVCVTERVPVLDMVRVRRQLDGGKTRLLGPNSPGLIVPQRCKIGVMPGQIHAPGRVGIMARSASLAYEAALQTTANELGQSTVVGIGADPVVGLGFVECLELFLDDPATEVILLIGEIGGSAEEEAAEFLAARRPDKPVVAYVAGRSAPPGRRMGHAGTLDPLGHGAAGEAGDAERKSEALRAAGVRIAPSVSQIGATLEAALRS